MLEQIKEVLVNTCNVDPAKVTMEATLKEDLAIDSLDSVEIVMAIEEKFDTTIEDDEIQTLVTVGDIVNLLKKKGF